jgi:hypothetical protein
MEIAHRKRVSASVVAICRFVMRYMLDHLDLPITETEGHYQYSWGVQYREPFSI